MNKVVFISYFIQTITVFERLFFYLILARILMSWMNQGRRMTGPVPDFLRQVTDPILNLAKKIPHKIGMIDLSPIIAMLGVQFAAVILINLLSSL